MVTPCIRYLGAKKRIPSHFWSLLLIAALSCCATSQKNPARGDFDEALQAAVEEALAADGQLDDAAIAVTVVDGIVDLSGTVGSTDQVRRALRRAGEIDGVRGIVNRLRVIARQAPSRWLSEALQVLDDQ